MTNKTDTAPTVRDIPIGLNATGMRREFDSLGEVDVPVAVVKAAAADGVATRKGGNPVQAVQDEMWQPTYPDGAAS